MAKDDDNDILKDAREAFEEAADAEATNRSNAEDDLRFARLADQWPPQIVERRRREDRPCLTINRMPAFIRQVVNDARQNKPSIKVHPVDSSADPAVAEIYSGLIRNIEQSSDADVAYDTAIESSVSGGWGYFRIGLDYAYDSAFDMNLSIDRVANPFLVYGDPASQAADSSDWDTAFVVDYMRTEAFEKQYRGSKPIDWNGEGYVELGNPWYRDNCVMRAEWWRREESEEPIVLMSDGSVIDAEQLKNPEFLAYLQAIGVTPVRERMARVHEVTQYILTGNEILETNAWPGKYIPIVPVYGDEVNVDGYRYFRSLIRDAKDPQRMFNFWRTASTELVALAPRTPFIGPKGSFVTDANKWASANVTSHAFIEYDGQVPPQRQPFVGPPAGALQEALNASDDMKSIMGIYDASLGARSNETSGRAILARQREGDVATFHFIDNMARAIRHAGRILIDLIPKVYSGRRMIRILGEDGVPQQIQMNTPMPVMGQNGMPQMDAAGNPLMKMYDLSVGQYDLTVTSGPSFTTKREEAANQMLDMVRSFPQSAPVIGDLIAKNLDWPGADEIAHRLSALLPPQLQQAAGGPGGPGGIPPQLQQAIQQGQQTIQAQAQEIQQLKMQLEALRADKQIDQASLQIDAAKQQTNQYKAETDRIATAADIAQANRPAHVIAPRLPNGPFFG